MNLNATMTIYKSDLIQVLTERGYMHQCTDLEGLDAKAASGCITGYIGFDATANSLHVGNLISIMMLRRMQQTGHRPIVLMGGGTTKVGDPSGKDEMRSLIEDKTISANIASIQSIFDQFLNFGTGSADAILVNNAEWLDNLHYIAFLRDIGRHFTINRMLTMDSVKIRLEREQPLTFLEFNYMILQGYDFVELHKRYECALQLGGSDQWGNIVQGTDLGRRLLDADLFGFTSPLITTASGAKMGKTANGAIWLKPERLSPYEYYQFWRNADDADVGRFLKLFTDLSLAEIKKLEKLGGSEVNDAKKILALEATTLLHGHQAADNAATTSQQTFEQGGAGDNLPSIELPLTDLSSGIAILALLQRAGFASSNGEARRLIRGGGAKINGNKIEDESLTVDRQFLSGGIIKISAGKKRHAIVRVS